MNKIEFEVTLGNNLFAGYKGNTLTVAHYDANMAFVKNLDAKSSDVTNILKQIASGDDVKLSAIIMDMASRGDPINTNNLTSNQQRDAARLKMIDAIRSHLPTVRYEGISDGEWMDFRVDVSYADKIRKSAGTFTEMIITAVIDPEANIQEILSGEAIVRWYYSYGINEEGTGFEECIVPRSDMVIIENLAIKFATALKQFSNRDISCENDVNAIAPQM